MCVWDRLRYAVNVAGNAPSADPKCFAGETISSRSRLVFILSSSVMAKQQLHIAIPRGRYAGSSTMRTTCEEEDVCVHAHPKKLEAIRRACICRWEVLDGTAGFTQKILKI